MKEMDKDTPLRPLQRYIFLENLTATIFRNSGFHVEDMSNTRNQVDIIAKKDGVDYYIEVKSSTSLVYRNYSALEDATIRTVDVAVRNNAVPVLVIFAVVSEKSKQKYTSRYNDIAILDLANLLYIVNGTELQDELISLLPFSVDHIEPVENNLDLGWLCHSDEATALLCQLDNCIAGKEGAKDFEDICTELLKYIFADDLSLWKKQAKSNDGLYRFDLLCRIKDDISKSFWRMMEDYFHSKYIVFEFKNYNEKVTQKEIYTTERYLYSKALRNIAIIIAKNGFDENSVWAAKGSLREYGKLILPVTVTELKQMVELKRNQEDPSEFFLSKLDNLLVELEK